jgi:undecaprenyl-diphosphatase
MSVLTPPRTRLVVGAAVALAVAVVLGLVARATSVTTAELDVSRWSMDGPSFVARPIWLVMQVGGLFVGMAVGVVAMGLLRGARGAAAAAVAVGGAWFAAKVGKAVVDRGRPADYLAVVETRFEPVLHGSGYPSGHTCIAFALAVLVAGSLSGWWRSVPWVIATAVAAGRLYFGAHLLLDVVGGAALGIALGLLVRLVFGLDDGGRADRPVAGAPA